MPHAEPTPRAHRIDGRLYQRLCASSETVIDTFLCIHRSHEPTHRSADMDEKERRLSDENLARLNYHHNSKAVVMCKFRLNWQQCYSVPPVVGGERSGSPGGLRCPWWQRARVLGLRHTTRCKLR